ncbi:MAG: hypothetical protein AAGG56_02155 [Pseudomonadota bacterium]
MSIVVSFPAERARKPGEDAPAIVAVRGCEIHQFTLYLTPRPPQRRLDPETRARRGRKPEPRAVPTGAVPDDEKLQPLVRVRELSARDARDEINILLAISDTDLAVSMLVALIGASSTHRPLPHGWPKVMYAIRGRISLHVALGRDDSARLMDGVRMLLDQESDTAWA